MKYVAVGANAFGAVLDAGVAWHDYRHGYYGGAALYMVCGVLLGWSAWMWWRML